MEKLLLPHSTLTPWQRLEAVIAHYQFPTVSAFARHLGLKRSETLYQIKKGNNGISIKVASTICSSFPEISKAWLLTGEGEMFLEKQAQTDQIYYLYALKRLC